MKGIATFLVLLFIAICIAIGFVYYDSDTAYFTGEQAKELSLLLAASIMANRLKWRALHIILVTLSALSLCELIDEINGRNTTVFANDYILLSIAAIVAIYLLISQWLKSKKNS